MQIVFLTNENQSQFLEFIQRNLQPDPLQSGVSLYGNGDRPWKIQDELDIKRELSFAFFQGDRMAGIFLAGENRNRGHISLLLVEERYRHRGIGTALLQQGIQLFQKRNGCEEVCLEVFEENQNAFRLYLQNGFSSNKKLATFRNHSKSFFRNENSGNFTMERMHPFMLQPLFSLFPFDDTQISWIRNRKLINKITASRGNRVVLFRNSGEIVGYAVFSSDGYTLRVYDFQFHVAKEQYYLEFFNHVVKKEQAVEIRGIYMESREARILRQIGFYEKNIQIEMRMVI